MIAGADRGNAFEDHQRIVRLRQRRAVCAGPFESASACTGRVGVMGICIGGHLSFRAAMNPEVLAGVCFAATDIHKRGLGKGTRDNTLDRVGEIKGEMLMLPNRQDPHVPREGRALIYHAMADAGGTFPGTSLAPVQSPPPALLAPAPPLPSLWGIAAAMP